MKKPELLMPAGSLPVLKVAVIYGADAVYIGGEAFSLRAGAKNFTIDEIKEGIAFAHERGAKVYITANIYAHNRDLPEVEEYFKELSAVCPDGVLISDPGVFAIARRVMPDMDIHISTQANNTNYETFNFWYGLGVRRVVCARELSLAEIAQIRANIPEDMEIEAFVHGAMCISYSGRCLLSAYMTGRSANEGACTHPCRWKYGLEEESRPGQYMPVYENGRGTYIFNSKDLCMIEHLPEMIEAGIDSLKVEGRMKSALYVASVGRTYRMAVDDYCKALQEAEGGSPSDILQEAGRVYAGKIPFYKSEISKCTYREYTTGFFFGKPDETAQIYDASTYVKEWVYLGRITDDKRKKDGRIWYGLEQKNKFCVGDTVEVMKPSGGNQTLTVLDMEDEEGNKIPSCPHPKQHFYVDLGAALEPYDIIRYKP